MSNFRSIQRDMDFLFPPSMNDWLPEQHMARFIVEIIEQLDLREMERAYGRSGSAAFHPALLLSILSKYPPAKPGALVLLAPQRGEIVKRLKALVHTPNFN